MKYLIIQFSVLYLLLISGCINKNSQSNYPMKIEEVYGVVHVTNPGFPREGVRVITPVEELSISGEGDDENYLLARPRSLAVDNRGHIYVLDFKLYHVKVFDEKGKYVRTIAGKGQGPGELLYPAEIREDGKNRLHILDSKNRKISRYHWDGTFHSDLKLKGGGFPDTFYICPTGDYIVQFFDLDDSGSSFVTMLAFTFDGKILGRSKSFLQTKQKSHRLPGGGVVTPGTPFDTEAFFTVDGKGNTFYGFSDEYKFEIYNPDFEKNRVILASMPDLIEISNEDISEYINYLKKKGVYRQFMKFRDFPRYYALFSGIWMDDENRLIVQLPTNDDKAHYDVFNSQGIYLEKWVVNYSIKDIPLKNNFLRPIFKQGCIYCFAKDHNGGYFVKKYRLK